MTSLRTTLRTLAKSPGYSAVVVLILAVGIGASTAIFSVVNTLLLRPLAYEEPDALVEVQSVHPEQGRSDVAPGTFADLARDAHSFSVVAAQQYDYVNLTKTAAPARLTVVEASADYFRLFGVAARLGRTWTSAEARPDSSPVVVLGDEIWRTQFEARPDIVGTQVVLDDVAHSVIGVMPPSFTDPWGNAQLWRPIPGYNAQITHRSERYWTAFARLRPGTDLAQANSELQVLAQRLERMYPKDYQGWSLRAGDLLGFVVGDYRPGLLVVLGAVACVMLITWANVAGLSLVRTLGRRRELAVRAALGASGGQLLRQLLAESLALSLAGGALGVLLANWGVSAIVATFGNSWLPHADDIAVNAPVLLATLALTLATGVAFGLVPSWHAARTDANDALKEGGRGSAGPASRRLQSCLVIAEIALALVLLTGAGLLGRSLAGLLAKNPGMRTEQILTLGVSLPAKRYDSAEKRLDFYTRVEAAVAAVPGVASVGFTQTLPFTWGIPITLVPVGASNLEDQSKPSAYYDSVGLDFFRTAGIPLLAGRTFNRGDSTQSAPVIMISAATARRFFGTANPIGRFLRDPDPTQTARFEIVGVTGDVLRSGLATTEEALQIYRPITQRPTGFATLLVHTQVTPNSVVKSVQRAIWSIAPDQPVESVRPVAELVANSVTSPRLYLTLFGLFAGIALVLAAVGLYSLIAYGVAQRTREFGIRSALGALPREILAMVFRQGFALVALGLGLGLAGALATAHLLQTMIFSSSVHDPLVLASVCLLLAGVAGFACWLPARRAARVDPIQALRSE